MCTDGINIISQFKKQGAQKAYFWFYLFSVCVSKLIHSDTMPNFKELIKVEQESYLIRICAHERNIIYDSLVFGQKMCTFNQK